MEIHYFKVLIQEEVKYYLKINSNMLKMYTINTRANEPTKEIKWNHEEIQLI